MRDWVSFTPFRLQRTGPAPRPSCGLPLSAQATQHPAHPIGPMKKPGLERPGFVCCTMRCD